MNDLQDLRTRLHDNKGKLRNIARITGLGYDTILRIRDDENYEPGWSKVDKLARHFGIKVCVGGKK